MERRQAEKVESIYHQALAVPATERASYVSALCGGDRLTVTEVLRMLEDHAGSEATQIFDNPLSLGPGDLLCDRYRIVRTLGTGGMGAVYEAEDSELGERVALKTLRADAVLLEGVDTLRREVRITRSLTHPNICRVFDFGRDTATRPPVVFFTMELLAGETLRERQHTLGVFSLRQTRDIGISFSDALDAAHRAGVVHRDLKPGNIMMAGERVVVMDFGIARVAIPGAETRSGHLLTGTPLYMAPEQLVGGKVAPATDVYALGLLIYEMLSGRLPFDNADGQAALRRLQSPPLPLKQARRDVPDAWSRVVMRCLEQDSTARYQSAGELLQALRTLPVEPKVSKLGYLPVLAAAAILPVVLLCRPDVRVHISPERIAFLWLKPAVNSDSEKQFAAGLADDLAERVSTFQNGAGKVGVIAPEQAALANAATPTAAYKALDASTAITGETSRSGSGLQLSLNILPKSGRMRSEVITATSSEQLLNDAAGRIAQDLRLQAPVVHPVAPVPEQARGLLAGYGLVWPDRQAGECRRRREGVRASVAGVSQLFRRASGAGEGVSLPCLAQA